MKKVTFGARPPAPAPAASPEDWVADRDAAAEAVKRLTIDLPLALHRRVKTGCVREDVTIADVVRDYLDRRFPADDPGARRHDSTGTRHGGGS